MKHEHYSCDLCAERIENTVMWTIDLTREQPHCLPAGGIWHVHDACLSKFKESLK